MTAYELAKAQQAYSPPTLEEIIKQQADRIAELEKDGKVCATCGGLVYDPVIKQTKPLSDEEIIRCMVNPDVYSENEKIAGIRFARAIEERHGIK